MAADTLLAQAHTLWETLARVPVSFAATAATAGGVAVVTDPDSGWCPPGWAGVIRLGDTALVAAPDEAAAALLRETLAATTAASATATLTAPTAAPHRRPARVLGPAALAYLAAEDFRPAAIPAGLALVELPTESPELRVLELESGQEDANEAGLWESTSPVFAVRAEGQVVAAAGYRRWPGDAAHIGILTAPAWRNRGLARATGSAASAHALTAGLLPQWRARVPASRRVATSLGYRELGEQLSLLPASPGLPQQGP
ncbi:GCN5 family acetyltransferase [Kitasatospora sp. MMS16-BH015]|uniref:GNAT family N-acetyltransferase n=1 Tax=Kitasatospora sp. MMS16-BH015 TaxID=2018025 RepID=UPI000CA3DA5D|nr:GNAT family N-acetyltransferase [Kitasatospora sp. MMS16-BH015]AUG77630.1 GCN5 family acetyltransferase [Kitasatospora sp. MMS16-BH015]